MHLLSPEERESVEDLASPEALRLPVISIEELEQLCADNKELKELLDDMLDSCLKYTMTVARWQDEFSLHRGVQGEGMENIETLRTSVHDATIADINLFSRTLNRFGKDASWMERGGMNGRNRAAYGRFALTLTLSRL